ncbi:MAG: hypothetical protein JSV06_01505 [Myxococcales bacterium]|nr:MAG: hypothetical protein JSV06_01505 [Myxococcales bacterium]
MYTQIFSALDQWIARENVKARAEGVPTHRKCTIRVLGQAALWVAEVDLALTATQDVDAYADYDWAVQQELERLLAKEGKVLDPHGREVWMPRETHYAPLYAGRYVDAFVADPDAVLISKACKAPEKNEALITEYLAKGASERFFELAQKYAVDLERFV